MKRLSSNSEGEMSEQNVQGGGANGRLYRCTEAHFVGKSLASQYSVIEEPAAAMTIWDRWDDDRGEVSESSCTNRLYDQSQNILLIQNDKKATNYTFIRFADFNEEG